ncbi:MAG: hypothetical protein J6Z45_00110 [Oscillospiraceae bacterium]|nr:hypothetical protein [Oscillospiraceae bacterium]
MNQRNTPQDTQTTRGTRFRRLSAFVLSCTLVGNLCGIITTATAEGQTDYSSMMTDIRSKSLKYLGTRQNSDGSYGDTALVNDTADAVYLLRSSGADASAPETQAAGRITCLDEAAQLAAASANTAYLADYMAAQNPDGGFGLTAAYASDTYDTALTLFALGEGGFGSYGSAAGNAARWLSSQQAADGSFSYNDSSSGSVSLTALSLCALSKMRDAGVLPQESKDAPDAAAAYLRADDANDYSDQKIEDTLLQTLALLRYDKAVNAADIISRLNSAQHANGSFGKGIHATALACRLLNELENASCLLIDGMDTALSNTEAKAGKPVSVDALTTIQYQAAQDAALTLRMTVTNGKTPIYENSQTVQLSSGANSKEVTAGSFELNEEKDNGITAVITLLDGETVLKTETLKLTVEEGGKVTASEVTGLRLTLDRCVTYTGVPADVTVTGTVLYAANADSSADVTVKLLKNGKVLGQKTVSAKLPAEQNTVSVKLEGFTVDAAEKGTYSFEGVCSGGGTEFCSDKAEFEVLDKPAESESGLQVLWFQPVPDTLALYAGENRIVSSGAALIYNSDTEWNGTVKVSVSFGGETVTENSAPVTLEAQDIDSMDTFYGLPKYESDTLVSFPADKTGTYTVTAELTDAEGNSVAAGSREVTVTDKPKQDLILYSGKDAEGKTVTLRWNDISNETESYDYQLLRRIPGGAWEARSIWNESEQIDVLNVYPASPYLQDWMTQTISDTELPAGKGMFRIDSVHIDTYNQDPAPYMKNADGSWKYDVIFFGSSDCNSNRDLSAASADLVQEFVDDGRGVLFGHDTVCVNFGHYNFCRFADQLGILVKEDRSVLATTSVSVLKNGTLTNYPWNIRGTLTVPACHSYGQYVGGTLKGTEWMTLNATQLTDEATGSHSNFYLVTNNNLGMIQTGHSTGYATDDERKVLANTLFYLYQTSKMTDAKDASFYDVTAPDCPDAEVSAAGGKVQLKLHSEDHGTVYEYSIAARPTWEGGEAQSSNIVREEAFSGLNGFVVGVNGSREPSPELVTYDENGEFVQNVRKADSAGNLSAAFSPEELGSGSYLHLFAVDNANNVSEERIIPVTETVTASLTSDKQLYLTGETVTLRAETTAFPLSITADAALAVFDASDNKLADIAAETGVELPAGTPHSGEWTWQIPENAAGRLKAVITWTADGETLASAETFFRAGDEAVENRIVSDRQVYSVSDPVNLTNTVWNRSSFLTENALTLSVTVGQKGQKGDVQFTHSIPSINQNGNLSYADAIPPLKLRAGDYTASASVLQDGVVVSTAETEFTVEQNASGFAGTLDFKPEGKSVRTDFTVVNQSADAADNAEITVLVYANGSSTPAFTITKTASIPAGGSVDFSEQISPEQGEYSGVLKVSYRGTEQDLDYDGFTLSEETTVTTTATETTATQPVQVDAPKTGDRRMRVYTAGALLSLTGLAALFVTERRGGKKEHE